MPRRMRNAALLDDGSRRHIRRLRGLSTPKPAREPRNEPQRTGDRTQYEYGEPIEGLGGLTEFAREVEADADRALLEQIRHDGRTYWWSELGYPASRDAYELLGRRVRERFDRRGSAYYVEGVAKYRVYPKNSRGELQLHLVHALQDPVEVHVFMPATPAFEAAVRQVQRGTRIAVFAVEAFTLTDMNEPALVLTGPEQLGFFGPSGQ